MIWSRITPLGLLLGLLLDLACTPTVPAPYLPDRARVPGYEWPPRSVSGTSEEPPLKSGPASVSHPRAKIDPTAEPNTPFAMEPIEVPDSADEQCLAELEAKGVEFQALSDLRGVRTPVVVRSKLGGVDYYVQGGPPLRMDCRLAITLTNLGPVFAHHGISRVRFSGAYVYKTAPSGRLSHHAYGVAIDLHDFETKKGTLTVKRDFRRGAGCGRRVPTLNRLACDLKRQGVFEEFLTPDFNRAHRDHLHLSISRR